MTKVVNKDAKMHLRYDIQTAIYDCKESRHAQETMKSLGITYQHATPLSIADEWWFWNCEGVPDSLPRFLTELKIDPYSAVGRGLSKKDADKIANYAGTGGE